MSGLTDYTGGSLASDLSNRSAAGTVGNVTRFRTRLSHCQFPHRSCLSEQTSISLVSPDTRSLPQNQKPDGIDRELNIQEQRDRRSNWIVGYETGAEGSTVTRLEKILWGLRNLTMVGDNA